MPKIQIDAKNVVIVTGDRGGYKEGMCVACRATGWLTTEFGRPNRAQKEEKSLSKLTHSSFCPMNAVLNDDGSLKE